ncbi:hypothetical protein L0Y81_01390 [Burkholderia multivorans]|uniref:hypothetical protein n=1 Tax=Burkholderia multivorans TaxID=87883 RepID=UPI00158E95EE|nr:hypothetical protein [Burkholderia multivorans]MBR8455262.1 hypothetical protein [Burkholderia multivorans]MBU9451856.1 hypothetical protein [Burkholderia multivorans]MCL4643393.1 hypothetical protein [Burkholderia multivorans]UQN86021.1 hypothetical protein L0Y85_01320 [Burkholderia multivorans]UQO71223.1 hypothetical protein L0Y81_01390 [Burkholderia multivorans]
MAKPNIDLTDPIVKAGIQLYMERAAAAMEAAEKMDNAVRPIYALNPATHRVEQVGSCVLLAVKDQVFALSASHVFDQVGSYALLIGFETQLWPLPGDRFSTARGPSGTHADDPIDASVFHIPTPVPSELRAAALTLGDLDLTAASRDNHVFVSTGYRISQSRSTPQGHEAILERYPSVELGVDHYEHWKLDRNWHLLLCFEDHVLVNMRWQKSPSIRGFSGGGIFRVDGALNPAHRNAGVKLAAILTERKKGAKAKEIFPAVVGTRLGVHFGLIDKYLPDLSFRELLEDESRRQNI